MWKLFLSYIDLMDVYNRHCVHAMNINTCTTPALFILHFPWSVHAAVSSHRWICPTFSHIDPHESLMLWLNSYGTGSFVLDCMIPIFITLITKNTPSITPDLFPENNKTPLSCFQQTQMEEMASSAPMRSSDNHTQTAITDTLQKCNLAKPF